jgi:hypothetical protein
MAHFDNERRPAPGPSGSDYQDFANGRASTSKLQALGSWQVRWKAVSATPDGLTKKLSGLPGIIARAFMSEMTCREHRDRIAAFREASGQGGAIAGTDPCNDRDLSLCRHFEHLAGRGPSL